MFSTDQPRNCVKDWETGSNVSPFVVHSGECSISVLYICDSVVSFPGCYSTVGTTKLGLQGWKFRSCLCSILPDLVLGRFLMWRGTILFYSSHHQTGAPLKPYLVQGIYLHENFILIIEGLPIFPIVKGCHPDNLLFLVDNGYGENVLDHPPRII